MLVDRSEKTILAAYDQKKHITNNIEEVNVSEEIRKAELIKLF
jgi:hypothetical protein